MGPRARGHPRARGGAHRASHRQRRNHAPPLGQDLFLGHGGGGGHRHRGRLLAVHSLSDAHRRLQLLRRPLRLPRPLSQAARSRPATPRPRLASRGDHAGRQLRAAHPRDRQAHAPLPGALHRGYRVRTCWSLHLRSRRVALPKPTHGKDGVVVQAHGQYDRLLHRRRHRLLRGELPFSAHHCPLALAHRDRHAPHCDLDYLLQGSL